MRGLWTVRTWPEGLPWEASIAWHAFLLIAMPGRTSVIEAGEQLTEIPPHQLGFVTNQPTLLAANLLNCARIVQACTTSMSLA